ncbi:heme biosynthesis HemY N-terminal domain-containing protein [Agaribacter flavus]|uniref:Heme biosynthesis HemY N-terminal domain-containing protein n=1 Tax=Agaribacter flavus TaxID=1902781 RepID=A0ABV7FY26_9ALTE
MIKFILVLLLLFAALLLGHNLIGYEGRVVIATESTVIELTLISSLIIAFIVIILFWLLEWSVKKIIRSLSGSKNWLGALSSRQQNKAFYTALNAYLIGDTEAAKNNIEKSFGGDYNGTNYLLASELHKDKPEKALRLLSYCDEDKPALYLTIKRAQLLLNTSPKAALQTLDALPNKAQQTPIVVNAKLAALAKQDRWLEIKDLITQHKKNLGDTYIEWAQRATHGEFAEIASKSGANALKEKWANLSRAAKKDLANQLCYIQLLMDQNLHQEAETVLIDCAKKHTHAAFLGLFKQLQHANPAASIKFIEQKIKSQADAPEYYSVLAHLAFNSKDYALAQRAINKALELRQNNEDVLLLAAILEQQACYDQANVLYKKLLTHSSLSVDSRH